MTRLKRKYKIGDKFIPKDENMFWKEYKIVNYVAGIPKDEHLGFSYSIECKPTQADKPHQIMNIVEHLINSRMESISEKVEYKIKSSR